MQARLKAVQRAFIVVASAAWMIALVLRPAPRNAAYRRALSELTSLETRFDKARVQAQLLEHVRTQGSVPLATLAHDIQAIDLLRERQVSIEAARPSSLDPLARIELGTLADIAHFAQPRVWVPSAQLDRPALSRSLAWRLARDMPAGASPLLRSARILPQRVRAADVAREADVFTKQAAATAAGAAVTIAEDALARWEKLYEARVKRHVSAKLRAETFRARLDARKTLREAQQAQRDAEHSFVSAAMTASKPEPLSPQELPQYGIVQVEIDHAGKHVVYAVPVTLERRAVAAPPLRGATLTELHAAGLWDELKDMDIPRARASVDAHFNWHMHQARMAGVSVSGKAALQLLPCVLPLLLTWLVTRMRDVNQTYNPFRTRVQATLPRVGAKTRALDALALIVAPLTAQVFAIASLVLIGQLPVLPLISAVMSLLLGIYAFSRLGELQCLAEDVYRAHSLPPVREDSATQLV